MVNGQLSMVNEGGGRDVVSWGWMMGVEGAATGGTG